MKILSLTYPFICFLLLSGCGGSGAPKPAATADAAIMQVIDGLNDNQAAAPWNMLPASYQDQLSDVKNEFATKIDAGLWNSGSGVVQKLHSVLEGKKDLLLSSPMLAGVPMSQDLSANYDSLVSVIGLISESDLASLEGFKSMDIGNYLNSTGSDILKIMSEMNLSETTQESMGKSMDMMGKALNIKAELVSEEGDSAVVMVTTEGEEPTEMSFVRMEGKWVPEDLVNEFPEMISNLKKGVEGVKIPPETKAQLQVGITMVNGILDQIAAAETQEDLQGALMGIMMMMR